MTASTSSPESREKNIISYAWPGFVSDRRKREFLFSAAGEAAASSISGDTPRSSRANSSVVQSCLNARELKSTNRALRDRNKWCTAASPRKSRKPAYDSNTVASYAGVFNNYGFQRHSFINAVAYIPSRSDASARNNNRKCAPRGSGSQLHNCPEHISSCNAVAPVTSC